MTGIRMVAERLSARFGLRSDGDLEPKLRQGIVELGKTMAIPPELVVARGEFEAEILRRIAGRITIKESHFFRHKDQFRTLVAYVVRGCRMPSHSGPVVVWSAGCAAGQEPYSIAIALKEQLEPASLQRIRILATDVDADAVDRARQGTYHEWSLRGVDPARRERYFAASDHQRVELHRTIRRMVRFTTLSIQEHLGLMKPSSIDAILFRNVAIYLAADALERLYRRLAGVLRPDGLLFIGPCDPVPPSDTFVATGDTATFSKTPVVSPFPRGELEDRLPVAPDPLVFDAQASVSQPATPSTGQRDLDQKASQRDRVEADIAGAVCLADAGDIDAALHIAERLLGDDEENARAHMLMGQLRLAQRDYPGAVADFRSALFLRSDDPIARYWLAIALWRDGAARRCLLQLNALAEQLAELGDDVILEDGETTVAELARALTHTREYL